jgi:DNA primase
MKTERGKGPRRYLAGRGMDGRIMEEFSLGYAPADRGWLWGFLSQRNYTEEFLRQSGLFLESSRGGTMSLFAHRIVFPIANARGETIAFGGRALEDGVPKYLNTPETDYFRKGENLFGLDKSVKPIRTEGCFILVEGYMDLLALHQAGIHHVAAPLGTALTDMQVKILKRYASRAVLLFDSDAAGRKAAVRALELCERNGVEASVAEVSGDKDPADLMARGDAEAIRAAVRDAAPGFLWLLRGSLATHGCTSPEGRSRVCGDLFPLCAAADSRVRQESWLDMIADAIEVDRDAVRRDFRDSRARQPAPRDARRQASEEKRAVGPELFLMIAAALNRGAFEEVRRRGVGADDLDDAAARDLFLALEESYRAGDSSLAAVLSRLADEGLRTILREKASTDEFAMNPLRIVADGTRRIRLRSFERSRDRKIAELRRAQGKEDPRVLSEIQGEIAYLVGEIENLKVGDHARTQD